MAIFNTAEIKYESELDTYSRERLRCLEVTPQIFNPLVYINSRGKKKTSGAAINIATESEQRYYYFPRQYTPYNQ